MKRNLYFFMTLTIGIFIQIFFNRYLSLFDVGPNVLLMLVVAHGFIRGSLMGETLGFSWGLISDSMGVELFGTQALILTLAGYLAGKFRRRVASERPPAQVMIALFSTILYGLGSVLVRHFFEEGIRRSFLMPMILGMLFNILIVTAVFWVLERWINIWNLETEHV